MAGTLALAMPGHSKTEPFKIRMKNIWYSNGLGCKGLGFRAPISCYVQWGSEQQTSWVFKWFKTVILLNVPLFKPRLE